MRYYELTIQQQGASKPLRTWTSYPNGKPDPNALNIEFDIPVCTYAVPSGMVSITIEGISLSDLSEAQNFVGSPESPMIATLKGGMGGGLPLENPKQKGTIVVGQVFQAFGNWIGTDMTLDLVLNPSVFTQDKGNQGNFQLPWTKGTQLSDALQQCLSTAYQGKNTKLSINIADTWVATRDQQGSFTTLEGLAQYVGSATATDDLNSGVQIGINNGTVSAWDSSYQPGAVQLSFTDLVGQPTWIDVNQMQIKTVMRADLQLGSIIQMPKNYANAPGMVTTTAQSMPSSLKYKPTFTQKFQIIQLRQLGNFRSTDAGEWATVFNCVQL